jgi:hypothetical protein
MGLKRADSTIVQRVGRSKKDLSAFDLVVGAQITIASSRVHRMLKSPLIHE